VGTDTKSISVPMPASRAHLSWIDRSVLAIAGGLLCFLALRTYDRVEALMGRLAHLEGVVEVIRERGR